MTHQFCGNVFIEVDYRVTIWSVQGKKDQMLEEFLSLTIEEDVFESTILNLAVDLSHPWTMISDLKEYLTVFQQTLQKLNWVQEKNLNRRGRHCEFSKLTLESMHEERALKIMLIGLIYVYVELNEISNS